MTITFSQLEGTTISGLARGGLRLAGQARALAQAHIEATTRGGFRLRGLARGDVSGGFARGGFRVRGRARSVIPPVLVNPGFGFGGFRVRGRALGSIWSTEVAPTLPAEARGGILVGGRAEGYSHEFGVAQQVALRIGGLAASGGIATGGFVVGGVSIDEPPLLNYGFAEDQAPTVFAAGGMQVVYVGDAATLNSAPQPLPVYAWKEALSLVGALATRYEGQHGLSDEVVFEGDAMSLVFLIAADSLLLADSATPDATWVARVLERLVLAGAASSAAEAIAALEDALVLASLAEAFQVGDAADVLLTTEHIDTLREDIAAALDRVLMQGAGTGHYTLTVLVEDSVTLDGGAAHEADLVALVRDSVGLAMNIAFDSGEYIAWTMNTQSKGMSRYTNYPFNSFAKIGDRYVGCSAAGLHWLDGDTDDGAEIHARIRLGMDALGTRRLKRIPEAFIGYTSDGTLLLRVIQTSEASGEREEAIYRLPLRAAAEKRENRFKLGRGLKAVDFDFVVENVDGSNFELDSIEFRPILLDRRTRG